MHINVREAALEHRLSALPGQLNNMRELECLFLLKTLSEATRELLNQNLWACLGLFNWQVTGQDLNRLSNSKFHLNDHSDFPLCYVQPGASCGVSGGSVIFSTCISVFF